MLVYFFFILYTACRKKSQCVVYLSIERPLLFQGILGREKLCVSLTSCVIPFKFRNRSLNVEQYLEASLCGRSVLQTGADVATVRGEQKNPITSQKVHR